MDYLEIAGNMLERHEIKDSFSPGLLEITGVSQHGTATASGLNDYDYQSISSISSGQKQLSQLTTCNKVPIPPEVLEHFKNYKCHCMMGLFPEIGRAWFTIDSEIYIWTYEKSRDVVYYDGLNHVIISVGLVLPKKNVFIPEIKYLLVLSTPNEIIILGVTFEDTTKTLSSPNRSINKITTNIYEEMFLMTKPIFLISTDDVAITTIEGSADGRIFMGGRDGYLYEIYYQAESSWFSKRYKKINHSQSLFSYIVPNVLKMFSEVDPITKISIDNSRNLLYLLTDKGAIEAWDLSTDYSTMSRIARISLNNIVDSAISIINTVDASVFKPITSICPLTSDDCPGLHLIAVTQSGVRLYFSTIPIRSSQYQVNQQQQKQQQQSLQQQKQSQQQCNFSYPSKAEGLFLMHVRLPPGYTPNTTVNKPKQVHTAYFSQGTLILICSSQQDQDILWSISSAPFPNRPSLTECVTIMSLDGTVWNVGEINEKKSLSIVTNGFRKSRTSKKLVLLTNQGAHVITLLKPVDILHQLLVACHGPHNEAIKSYFKTQGEVEACVICLILACSEKYRGTDISLWAAQAFMLYGGDPSIQIPQLTQRQFFQSPGGGLSSINERSPVNPIFMSTPLVNRSPTCNLSQYQQQQQSLIQQSSQNLFNPINAQSYTSAFPEVSNIIYSAKHDGLYLYLSRLVRPFWKKRCVDSQFCSTISKDDCIIILEDLYAVRDFLTVNSINEITGSFRASSTNQNMSIPNGFGLSIPNSNISDQRNIDQAQTEEKKSLTALTCFIKHICEVISLWKILCEHQFPLLLKELTEEQKSILLGCTFRDLSLSRAETCSYLIIALINLYLKDNASVSTISGKLRDVCPNLYKHEDAVAYKATEILMQSKKCINEEERQENLKTALRLCKDAAPNLPLSNICQQFTSAKFYEGVIELTVTCAAKIDPEQLGLHFYRNNEPIEDREGYAAFAARMNCYKEVRQMLDVVCQDACNSNNCTGEFTVADGVINRSEQGLSFDTKIMKIIFMAMQSTDPLLHIIIYDWLLSHNLLSELLTITEPSLGEYFKRSVMRNPDNLQLADLLWKYYEKNNQHAAAAKILDKLSTMPTDGINLTQRIAYLARAVMCMRNDNVGYSVHNGVLLKDLEDKLEIARVQKVILDSLSVLDTPDAQEAVNSLNYTLYDMTQLYSDFAERFDLWECKLIILNCSHHNDPLLIESVWSQIINKEIQGLGTPQEKCRRLLLKMQSLVKEYGDSGHCFPLSFIVRELEIKCCQLKLSPSTIPDALVAMNLDIELLIDYYSRMIALNERVWANEGNEWHLVQSSTRLLDLLIKNSNKISNRNKRRIVAKAQDLVCACLNLLYPKQGTEHQMQKDLREVQMKLQRII